MQAQGAVQRIQTELAIHGDHEKVRVATSDLRDLLQYVQQLGNQVAELRGKVEQASLPYLPMLTAREMHAARFIAQASGVPESAVAEEMLTMRDTYGTQSGR